MADRLQPILNELRHRQNRGLKPMACGGHDTESPFITISRQAGAGGETFAHRLTERLNLSDAGDRPWPSFDRDGIRRVLANKKLAHELHRSIGEGSQDWLAEVFDAMSRRPMMRSCELRGYRMVAESVLALAEAGRVVLVGLGSAFITQQRTGGLHIRLVAPLSHRIENTAWARQLTRREALEFIRRTERRREAFFRRFWPEHSLSAESFCVTFNTASTTPDQQVDAILGMLPGFSVKTRTVKRGSFHAERPRHASQ